jgi:hypothetical protein
MRVRFGKPWEGYRNNVKAWRPRLTPWHAPDRPLARLYVAETCGPCSEVRRWFESRSAVALHVVAAEDDPTRDCSASHMMRWMGPMSTRVWALSRAVLSTSIWDMVTTLQEIKAPAARSQAPRLPVEPRLYQKTAVDR